MSPNAKTSFLVLLYLGAKLRFLIELYKTGLI